MTIMIEQEPKDSSSTLLQERRQLRDMTIAMNEMEVRHKKEIYWLRQEIGNARREKNETEDRMAALYQDLMSLTQPDAESQTSLSKDSSPQNSTQAQVYERTIDILGNQKCMLKTAYDQVVQNLKEEMSDLVEEGSRVEVNFMNQIANMEYNLSEKVTALEKDIQLKDEQITKLRSKQVQDQLCLGEVPAETMQTHSKTGNGADNYVSESKRFQGCGEQTSSFSAVPRSVSEEKVDVTNALEAEEKRISAYLCRVELMWAEAQSLMPPLIETVRLSCDTTTATISSNTQTLNAEAVPALEIAWLVDQQVQLAAILLETKLRNYLESFSLTQTSTSPWKDELNATDISLNSMYDMIDHAISCIEQKIRCHTSSNIVPKNRQCPTQNSESKVDQTDEVAELESKQEDRHLEVVISTSVSDAGEPTNDKENLEAALVTPSKQESTLSLLATLELEATRVAKMMKEKNMVMVKMKQMIDRQKKREGILKKELKRFMVLAGHKGVVSSNTRKLHNKISSSSSSKIVQSHDKTTK